MFFYQNDFGRVLCVFIYTAIRRCTSLISVSVAFVNWNEDVLFVNVKSIDDLWVLE